MNKESPGIDTQFVTFALGGEEYAVEALKVQEITGLPPVTKVPYLPPFVKGVINLRGAVMPVVDLRLKFGFEPMEYDKHTCIIVVMVLNNCMGMIVDAVSDVVRVGGESIEQAPSLGSKVRTDFMKGVGKIDSRLLIILDVDKILTDEELVSLLSVA